MIRLPPADGAIGSPERWALDLLVDIAGMLRVEDPAADVVSLVVEPGARAGGLTDARSRGWGVSATDGTIRLDGSVLALVARVASAADEQRTTAADRHDRVPSSGNALVRERLEGEPVLHDAALALRAATLEAAGRRPVRFLAPWPEGRRWAAAFTHDLDVVAAWPAFAALRWLELLRGGHVALATRAIGAAGAGTFGRPVRDGVERVLATEARHGVRASWYVLAGSPTVGTIRRGDLTYRPESAAARSIVASVTAAGHEIGLHGSFATGRDAAVMAAERQRLAALAAQPVSGVRQHFLKMRPGETQRAMVAAGFTYDATFGFPDRNGFRLGIADVVPGFLDARDGTPLALDVVPLVWMDRALSKYQGIEEPERWVDEALRLASSCRSVGGLWTGLWHPNLTDALGYPGAPRAFDRLIDRLLAMDPWVAPVAEVVAWRAARRAVRLTTLAPDGSRAAFAPVSDSRLAIEDPDGRVDVTLSRALHAQTAAQADVVAN